MKGVSTLDHIKERNDESLRDFYTRFTNEFTNIDQVITGREAIHAFGRALGPKGSKLYNSLSIIPINTVEVMTERVKSYIDPEIAKDSKTSKQHPHKNNRKNEKRHLVVPHPNREVYETYIPLNQEISIILNEMEKRD